MISISSPIYAEPIAGRKSTETIGDDLDLILETERAVDGNVHKALALERLFYKLLA